MSAFVWTRGDRHSARSFCVSFYVERPHESGDTFKERPYVRRIHDTDISRSAGGFEHEESERAQIHRTARAREDGLREGEW